MSAVSGSSDAGALLAIELDKIRHQTTSNLVHQKRPATLLLAIEGTLNEQGTAVTPVAYLVALLSTSEQLAQSADVATGSGDHGETLQAALYLLALVLPFSPSPVVRSKSSALLQLSAPLLASLNDQAPAVKSLLTIIQCALLAMDATALNQLYTTQVFNSVLSLIIDPRPKVRRKAQEAVCMLLASPPAPSIKHPYAIRTAEFIMESLKDSLQQGKKGSKKRAANQDNKGGAASEEASRAIALCAIIKMIGKDWPASAIGPLCALLLTLPRLSNAYLTSASYDILEQLFTKSSDSFEEGKIEEILSAVLDARPDGNGTVEERILPGWLGTVEHGFVAFARSSPEACTLAVFPTVRGVMGYLSSTVPAIRAAATSTLTALVRYCITSNEITYSVSYAPTGEVDPEHPLHAICDALLSAVRNIKNQAVAMPHLLQVIASTVLKLRVQVDDPMTGKRVPAASALLAEHIKVAGHLRGTEGFEYREAAELVLGAATEVCGPEWLLHLIPLNLIDSEKLDPEEAGRAWLLPILRSKVTNTHLSHFTSYFVPLSESIYIKYREAEGRADAPSASEAVKKRAGIEAKVYEAVVAQIWALFPGYCDLPVDLPNAFTPAFCEILSNVMYSQSHLRPPVFRGLQLLVERNASIVASASPREILLDTFGLEKADGEANLALLARLATDLLAVMFNVFSSASKEGRGYILDCIAAYLGILSPEDRKATFTKIQGLLTQALAEAASSKTGKDAAAVPQTMLDFMVQMVPFLPDVQTAESLLKLVLSDAILQNTDTAVQKKAYRILVRLCEPGNATGERCMRDNLELVVQTLIEKNSAVAASAKKDRTCLLATIIPMLPTDRLHVIPSIIPEAVLATKEANEAARSAAYDLLVGMGEKMKQGGVVKRSLITGFDNEGDETMDDTTEGSVSEYLTMVAAGLAGKSPHMISATITALSRLLFEYNTQVPSETVQELVATVLVFLASPNREVVKSTIGFVKVAVVALPAKDIQPHLSQLIPALLEWSHEHKNHFKLNIRHIFERLIRKFGYETIEKLTQEDDRKLLQSIRKRQIRAKRKKEQNDVQGDVVEDVNRPQATRDAYEDALYGSEDEEGESEDEAQAKPSKSGRVDKGQAEQPRLRKNAIGRKKGKADEEAGSAYIREDADEPLDLLDDRMLGRISRANPNIDSARRAKRADPDAEGGRGYKTDSKTGKMIFADSDEDRHAEDAGKQGPIDSTNAYLEAIMGEDGFRRDDKGRVKINKSTKRSRAQLEEDELVEDVKDKLADLGVAKQRGNQKKPKRSKEAIGQEFKAKRAGGDIKKANGPNPYAYVPLSSGKKNANVNIVNKGKRR